MYGSFELHEELEEYAAEFFNSEAALFFSSGYLAGQSLVANLPARGDAIIYDSLLHACMRDGERLSLAKGYKAAHNDLSSFEDCIKRARANGAKDVWIAVEALYSMDGDFAPIDDFISLAKKYSAWLIVDEAHSSGVYGNDGSGITSGISYDGLITLHTCGKAFGVAGGLVCASKTVIDVLINSARGFIYTTAPMPLQAYLVKKAISLSKSQPWRREAVLNLSDFAKVHLSTNSKSHIISIIIGDENKTLELRDTLQNKGFAVSAVRPPTVPKGSARIRISINSLLEERNVIDLASEINLECKT